MNCGAQDYLGAGRTELAGVIHHLLKHELKTIQVDRRGHGVGTHFYSQGAAVSEI